MSIKTEMEKEMVYDPYHSDIYEKPCYKFLNKRLYNIDDIKEALNGIDEYYIDAPRGSEGAGGGIISTYRHIDIYEAKYKKSKPIMSLNINKTYEGKWLNDIKGKEPIKEEIFICLNKTSKHILKIIGIMDQTQPIKHQRKLKLLKIKSKNIEIK